MALRMEARASNWGRPGRREVQTHPWSSSSFLQVPLLMAWAPACRCLETLTQHQTEEILLHRHPNLALCNTHLIYGSGFTLRRHIPPYLRNRSSATQSYLLCSGNLFPSPSEALLEPDSHNHCHFLVVEPQINNLASQVIIPPCPPHTPDSLLPVNQRPPCLGTPFTVGLQSSGFPSGKWLCTARNVTHTADLKSSLLLPSTWGLIAHYILFTYLWIPTWSDMCLSLFSKGIKKRNSNCWAQWSESRH